LVTALGAADAFGLPVEFAFFAATLLGVALFHRRTLTVALTGLAAIVLWKIAVTGFAHGSGFAGLAAHLAQEWVLLANLLLLLTGFALLSRHFELSNVPEAMPGILPDDWKGGFLLLVLVCALSAFLDNIAAALIGGTIAKHVFKGRVHVGYLAAVVAASNAGGAGSVVGDTTTTMMWIAGVSPLSMLEAYVATAVALLVFGVQASRQQQRFSPIARDAALDVRVEWARVAIVLAILAVAFAANVVANVWFPSLLDQAPVIGIAVWVAILLAAPLHRPDWAVVPNAVLGALFLLALVVAASMMPVERLPAASWQTALGVGFLSAVFNNIPLTALALEQGGYDWGLLAFAIGFGGSIVWFGSSAGVAIADMFPEAKSATTWLRKGWLIVPAYVAGFFAMLALLGWRPG
jgi:Na+/H+ antiporter NhaD/arsenite permease-like protein